MLSAVISMHKPFHFEAWPLWINHLKIFSFIPMNLGFVGHFEAIILNSSFDILKTKLFPNQRRTLKAKAP